mmetsp:Transcript_5925/g.13032  ORF Transcript_5925/g.13032 Transcript_5925/m.13032 type:complete len:366 (+) Transcript_5925:1-1098(+)
MINNNRIVLRYGNPIRREPRLLRLRHPGDAALLLLPPPPAGIRQRRAPVRDVSDVHAVRRGAVRAGPPPHHRGARVRTRARREEIGRERGRDRPLAPGRVRAVRPHRGARGGIEGGAGGSRHARSHGNRLVSGVFGRDRREERVVAPGDDLPGRAVQRRRRVLRNPVGAGALHEHRPPLFQPLPSRLPPGRRADLRRRPHAGIQTARRDGGQGHGRHGHGRLVRDDPLRPRRRPVRGRRRRTPPGLRGGVRVLPELRTARGGEEGRPGRSSHLREGVLPGRGRDRRRRRRRRGGTGDGAGAGGQRRSGLIHSRANRAHGGRGDEGREWRRSPPYRSDSRYRPMDTATTNAHKICFIELILCLIPI